MFERLKKERLEDHEGGFTLIELLVVIAILGILAAIVVFSVAGINDKGQLASCKTDTTTIQTAEEANFAKTGSYLTGTSALVSAGFLSTASTWHNVTSPAPGTTGNNYVITEASGTCGNNGDGVDNIPTGTTGAAATTIACTSGSTAGTGGWGDC